MLVRLNGADREYQGSPSLGFDRTELDGSLSSWKRTVSKVDATHFFTFFYISSSCHFLFNLPTPNPMLFLPNAGYELPQRSNGSSDKQSWARIHALPSRESRGGIVGVVRST